MIAPLTRHGDRAYKVTYRLSIEFDDFYWAHNEDGARGAALDEDALVDIVQGVIIANLPAHLTIAAIGLIENDDDLDHVIAGLGVVRPAKGVPADG